MSGSSSLLGHVNVQTTQVYLHVNDEDLRQLVQGEPEPQPAPDPEVAAAAAVLAGLTDDQRAVLAWALGRAEGGR